MQINKSEFYYAWFCNKFIFEPSCHVTMVCCGVQREMPDPTLVHTVIQLLTILLYNGQLLTFRDFCISSKASTTVKQELPDPTCPRHAHNLI